MIIMASSQIYGSETEKNNNKHSLHFNSCFAVWFLSTNDLVLMAVAVIEINVDGATNACIGSVVLCYLCNSCHWESVSIGWAQSRFISPHIIREFDTQIVPVPEIFKANCCYSTTTVSFQFFIVSYFTIHAASSCVFRSRRTLIFLPWLLRVCVMRLQSHTGTLTHIPESTPPLWSGRAEKRTRKSKTSSNKIIYWHVDWNESENAFSPVRQIGRLGHEKCADQTVYKLCAVSECAMCVKRTTNIIACRLHATHTHTRTHRLVCFRF